MLIVSFVLSSTWSNSMWLHYKHISPLNLPLLVHSNNMCQSLALFVMFSVVLQDHESHISFLFCECRMVNHEPSLVYELCFVALS